MARTARDTLNELKWRGSYDFTRAKVWVADRTWPGGGRVLNGSEIVGLEHRYFTTARATIPFYKVLRIEYEGRILYERPAAPQG